MRIEKMFKCIESRYKKNRQAINLACQFEKDGNLMNKILHA